MAVINARAKSGGALPSRAEQRFMETYRRDVLKSAFSCRMGLGTDIVSRLVPFMLIILVAEELIPFVALYAPRMLPSTCVLPGQRDRILSRARDKQLSALFSHRSVLEAIGKEGSQSGFVPIKHTGNPGAICRCDDLFLSLPWPFIPRKACLGYPPGVPLPSILGGYVDI